MFKNKVVLITGSSAGIGAQTAIDFAKEGAQVVITGRNVENLSKVSKDCEDISPFKIKPLQVIADVSNVSDNERLIKSTIEHFKQLDILVNNAGILAVGNIETTSLEQYDSVMNINLRSVYHLTMLAVPYLLETKGNIVNVSSVNGLRSFPNVLAYCTSKAALDQFTRCVALELAAKGVRVNSVNPGVINTGLHLKGALNATEYEAYIEKCNDTHPIGRPGLTTEVSSTILFLAGDGATNITGATIPVDGGKSVACPR